MTGIPPNCSIFANICTKLRSSQDSVGRVYKRRSRLSSLACCVRGVTSTYSASLLVLFTLAMVQSVVASTMLNVPSRLSANTKTIKKMTSISIQGMACNIMQRSSPTSQSQYKRSTSCFVPYLKHPSILYSIPSYSTIKLPTAEHCRYSSHSSSKSLSMSSPMPSSKWEQITNHKTSKTVKLFKSVHRANKSKRSELGLTVAEGVRLVSDILANEESRRLVRRIVISESLVYGENTDEYQQQLQHWIDLVDEESRQNNQDISSPMPTCSINIGNDQVVAACSATVASQGVVALMDIPAPYNPLDISAAATNNDGADADSSTTPPFYLILDGLSDPGNVGTLLRTSAASHVTALILLPGSCDVWNPKAVRSAMGASFRIPVLEMSKFSEKEALDHVLDLLESCGIDSSRVFAATMEASGDNASLAHYDIDFTSEGGAAVIMGREGEGLRRDVLNAIKRQKISTVHVPMAPGMESLNAAVCGSVIMFERMRQLFQ